MQQMIVVMVMVMVMVVMRRMVEGVTKGVSRRLNAMRWVDIMMCVVIVTIECYMIG